MFDEGLTGEAELLRAVLLDVRGEEEAMALRAQRGLRLLGVADVERSLAEASPDARFAAAVAEFGMLLRDSPHRGRASRSEVLELARPSAGDDPYRREFLELVKQAQAL